MEKRPAGETNVQYSSNTIPHLLRNLKSNYSLHKNTLFTLPLPQNMDPIHNIKSYFPKLLFIIPMLYR
jgi:hypothetical protein